MTRSLRDSTGPGEDCEAIDIVIVATDLMPFEGSSTTPAAEMLAGRPMALHLLEQLERIQTGGRRHIVVGASEAESLDAPSGCVVEFGDSRDWCSLLNTLSDAGELDGAVVFVSAEVPSIPIGELREAVSRGLLAQVAVVLPDLTHPAAVVCPRAILSMVAERVLVEPLEGSDALTKLVALISKAGAECEVVPAEHHAEHYRFVRDRVALREVERQIIAGRVRGLLEGGVRIRDPGHFHLRGRVTAGTNVDIDVGVVFEGRVVLGDDVSVGAYSILRDVEVGSGSIIREYSLVEGASVGHGCRVGPFARVRPKTVLSDHVQVGNYVEIKASIVGAGAKINHHSYIGDALIGKNVIVGAGTITCNFDGLGVNRTIVEDDAFIGSGTELVAPVRVGRGATIGAGSTVTSDAPPERLTLARARQTVSESWRRPASPEDSLEVSTNNETEKPHGG